MTKRLNVGDVILIPLKDNIFGIGKILFLSKRFKNVILLGVYDQFVKTPSMPTSLGEISLKLYTGQQAIKEGPWILVGNETLLDSQRNLSKCIVADDVWFEDQKIRTATADDFATLPELLALGRGLVEKKVQELIQHHLI
jgi:hypothetical protein